MEHKCPECGGWWKCKEGCTEDLIKERICSREKLCYKCRQIDQLCDCINCEYGKRYGNVVAYISNSTTCRLCGKAAGFHEGYHCPEKREWNLRCGARVVVDKNGFEFEILTGTHIPGIVNFSEIPLLIKILEEIGGNDENKL